MHLDYLALRSLYTVVKIGSFKKAAQGLKLSEAGVRRHIRVLEKNVGYKLFDNIKQRLILTDKGHILFKYAEQSVMLDQEMQKALHHESKSDGETLSIGTSNAIGGLYFSDIIAKYEANLKFRLFCSDKIDRHLKENLDIILWTEDLGIPDIYDRLFVTNFYMGLYASKAYLDQHGRPEKSADLKAHFFLSYPTSGFYIYQDVDWYANFNLGPMLNALETNSGIAIARSVDNGVGIGSMSSRGAQLLKNPYEQVLQDYPGPEVPIYLYVRSGQQFSEVKKLLKICQAVLSVA